MVKKRGLGKSLDALLAYTSPTVQEVIEHGNPAPDKLTQLPIDCLQRGKYQPRRDMDPQALEELANSIRTQGIIQPLVVRSAPGGKYEIIAGERRWQAARLAGLQEVPAIIRAISDHAAIAIALIENIQRENLNPIEQAVALQRLIEEFAMTHQQVAEAVSKSRTSVTNLLRLLALPEEVKILLERKQLEMGHARSLITLPESVQLEAAQIIITRNLSVRETESLVRRLQTPAANVAAKKEIPPDIRHLQDNLTKQLQMRVAIQHHAKGKGKLVIHYRSLTELNGLLAQFREEI